MPATPKSPLLLLLVACAAHRPELAQQCESFAAFDGELPADASDRERSLTTCARHVIEGLLELRETQGLEAVQRELDAMTHRLGAARVERLIDEGLGPGNDLGPLLSEARARSAPAPAANRSAREVVREASALPLGERVAALEEALEDAAGDSARGALTVALSEARGALDQSVARAVERRQLPLVALMLAPLAQRPEHREAVAAARARALEWVEHQQRAGVGDGWRAVLTALARRLGGDPADAPRAGTWLEARWTCAEPAPTLPPLPPGMRAQLTAQCGQKQPHERRGDEVTFELERELSTKRVTGTVKAWCGGGEHRSALSALEPGLVEEAMGPIVETLRRACVVSHRQAAERLCQRASLDLESAARLADHGVAARGYAPCFERWFEASSGVPPPPVW